MMRPGIQYGTSRDDARTAEAAELYEVLKNEKKESYHTWIEKKKSPLFLYHLADMRTHLLEWYPFLENERILEIGAGAGALTDLFVRRGAFVDAVEPNAQLAECNAIRQREESKFQIFAGYLECALREWKALKKRRYDGIILAGALDVPSSLMGRNISQEEVVQLLGAYLKPGGRLFLAMQNRLGLKYWAGCRDETTGEYFSGLEGRRGGATRRELTKLLEDAGFADLQFYYPYPDHIFPMTIYSDEYLPREGELRWNLRNYDSDRYRLFDERKVYDTLLAENCYPMFANSYLVICRRDENR